MILHGLARNLLCVCTPLRQERQQFRQDKPLRQAGARGCLLLVRILPILCPPLATVRYAGAHSQGRVRRKIKLLTVNGRG